MGADNGSRDSSEDVSVPPDNNDWLSSITNKLNTRIKLPCSLLYFHGSTERRMFKITL